MRPFHAFVDVLQLCRQPFTLPKHFSVADCGLRQAEQLVASQHAAHLQDTIYQTGGPSEHQGNQK